LAISGVTASTHAIHSCGIQDGDQIIYGGEAAGYVLHLPDQRTIYFAGDTAVFSDMELIERLYKPELAFLPIGDFYTMGPREAALACQLLNVRKVIPMHFGTFPALVGTPAELARELNAFPRTEVWPLEIGKPVKW
jgi:L-ascorbate metabolism protein UlaG (beta-lactamase superfamily)